MRLRRNTVWWFKLSAFLMLLLCGIYVTLRQALNVDNNSHDHKINKKDSPLFEENYEFGPKLNKHLEDVIIGKKVERIDGPGENGQAYYLPPGYDKEKDKLYRENGFNARASDDISLNRSLPDIRHSKCRELKYPSVLPSTSVIIPFFNEHWSTLLRTFTSVLNRSPAEILLEVILVDDGSNKDFLKEKLDKYVENIKKVKVIHLAKRAGLIRARLAGAKAAKGDVIIFLDSHTECTEGWLPPLLTPISENSRTCVCPFIDVIDYETFAYRAQDEGARGAFDWELFYKRLPILESDTLNLPNPFKSPVMAGGLFAISANFFWELGGYDPGLEIWGGEQYELSFKIWQCGGTMIDAPCSRIGHIYRKFAPFSNPGGGDFLGRNYKRVAEVWMDEYAEYVYKHRPHYRSIDPGDLTEQHAIRKKLNCKSFKWFMTEIAFDLVKVYPPVEPPDFANGTITSVAMPHLCIDTQFKNHQERFGLRPCQNGGEQVFHLTWHKDIRASRRTLCWDVSSGDSQAPVLLYSCHGGGGNQMWKYDYKKQQLIHGGNPRCLDSNPGSEEIFISTCDSEKVTQHWIFQHYEEKRIDNWDNDGLLFE